VIKVRKALRTNNWKMKRLIRNSWTLAQYLKILNRKGTLTTRIKTSMSRKESYANWYLKEN